MSSIRFIDTIKEWFEGGKKFDKLEILTILFMGIKLEQEQRDSISYVFHAIPKTFKCIKFKFNSIQDPQMTKALLELLFEGQNTLKSLKIETILGQNLLDLPLSADQYKSITKLELHPIQGRHPFIR